MLLDILTDSKLKNEYKAIKKQNEIEVYGGYLGKYYMRKVAQIIESGILPLDKIVTDVIPASRYQEALDLAASKQCGKVFVAIDF